MRAEIIDNLLIENAYEAILVNSKGYLTEGSRSNVFLLKGDELFTAPDRSVLGGITRRQIINICLKKGIRINYALIHRNQLADFNTIFMTGTSPGILPFCCISSLELKPEHWLIPELLELYGKKVEESLRWFQIS